MIRHIFLALALVVSSLPVHAAEPEKAGAGAVGQYVDLQPVGLPIVADGKLVNYVFVYVRINLTVRADVALLRQKEPYFRDALVRAGHRSPFTLKDDYSKIDAPRLVSVLTRDAIAIVGPGQIRSIVITQQTPRRRVAMPRA